jgi:putative ABC transport system permease protein
MKYMIMTYHRRRAPAHRSAAQRAGPAAPGGGGRPAGPAGRALCGAVQSGGPQGSPAAWSLLAMVAGLLLAVAALTAVPARIGARRPVAEILQSEAA